MQLGALRCHHCALPLRAWDAAPCLNPGGHATRAGLPAPQPWRAPVLRCAYCHADPVLWPQRRCTRNRERAGLSHGYAPRCTCDIGSAILTLHPPGREHCELHRDE